MKQYGHAMTKYMDFSVACQRLGKAMFGEECAKRLSDRQLWILQEVGPAERLSSIEASVSPFAPLEFPKHHPAISADEARMAIQALHLWERHTLKASDWMENHKIGRNSEEQVCEEDFEREFARAFPTASEQCIDGAIDTNHRRGRNTVWDWEGAMRHLVIVANTPDGLPQLQADTERLVARYFEDRTDGHSPVTSAIRAKVAPLYKK
jgi:hypothetical protein